MELFRLPATELASKLASNEVSSVDLVRAHLGRIEACEPKIHAFTEVMAGDALERADKLDRERRAGRVRSSIHGLPVSIKECFDIEGRATTLGVPARVGRRAPADAAMVTALREAGAVIVGRTNLSQFMLFSESRNPVFGQTNNPFEAERSPGGSSGGEAAAIASGMSPLGFGTDIGGSIRVPAHFTGTCGIKLTLDRWPMLGVSSGMQGQEAIRAASGPMARTTADLVLVLQALSTERLSQLDPRVPPLAFGDPGTCDVKGLRVGYFVDDGIVPASAAVSRATMEAVSHLRDLGAKVVPFTVPRSLEAIVDYFATLSSDGGVTVSSLAEGGPIDEVLRATMRTARLPRSVRHAVAFAAERAGQGALAAILRAVGEKSVSEFWAFTHKVRGYRAEFLRAMGDAGVDVILCPPHATCAVPHGGTKDFTPAGSFSMLFNMLQFPGGVVPVTRVANHEAERMNPKGLLERKAASVDKGSVGLPIGVQVVAPPWKDETVLAVMAAVERAARQSDAFPLTPVDPWVD